MAYGGKEWALLKYDSGLKNYAGDIDLRERLYHEKKRMLVGENGSLVDFANGHHYFGLHRTEDGCILREWAPGADEIHLMGDFNGWDRLSHPMRRIENGIFEIRLYGDQIIRNGQKYKLLVTAKGVTKEHLPAYSSYVVQDTQNFIWCSEAHYGIPFEWHDGDFAPQDPPLIYECHVGMATDQYRIGTYTEFRDQMLPRVKADGYNTIQVMAIMEHPYYASFGYQVSNFFAASSRYGTPEELKSMIDRAHTMGIRVLLDIVHSHAAPNEAEGLNGLDGTDHQYFHQGKKGDHSAWGTKLFNYGKNEVLHFLLSNCKYWMEEYHFDGFRYDGVTSMLYQDHGLGQAFDNYKKYFSLNTDMEAIVYLMLANDMIHAYNSHAITIAEDMSGMPGMCVPIDEGGIGFDYRLGMGVPDMWIRTLRDKKDEDWDLGSIWYELTSRRPYEKVIGYAESHDQALVGDKTIMFRLCDKEMYWAMNKDTKDNGTVNRGIALHKMIRLLTFSLGGDGYLNFMGNEFGHPEWIDFPREGNDWSYHYARRQWNLEENGYLKYRYLGDFDKAMLALGKQDRLLEARPHDPYIHQQDKILIYEKNGDIFAFNLNPTRSFESYFVPAPAFGTYKAVLSTDDESFGGYSRVSHETEYHSERRPDGRFGFYAYLPSRTAVVFSIKKTEENTGADNL